MLTVVTSFSPAGFEQYGRTFVGTFQLYWPKSIRLICYWEGPKPEDMDLEGFDLLQTEPCATFLKRHRDDPVIAGQQPGPARWGPKAIKKGYSYKHDAYKFARKIFAIAHAARETKTGKLFWLDADIVTHRPVSEALLHELLPDDTSLCHLARPGYYSECGFVGYNLDEPAARAFIRNFESLYATDDFMRHTEWHDSWLFDRLMDVYKPKTKRIDHTHNQQPLDHSVLGQYMTHLKGARKDLAA